MKTFTTFIVAVLISLTVSGQNYREVSLKEATEIANRNAKALWGDVDPAWPIPYYAMDGKLVAWRFNYAVGKTFPDGKELMNRCEQQGLRGDKYQQWGGDDYGRILISARSNMPVVLEYSRSLSSEYALGKKLERLAGDAFPDGNVEFGKIYYLDHFNVWHEIKSGDQVKYVCLSPTGGILDAAKFEDKKAGMKLFCKTGDFSKEWETYREGYILSNKADKYIPEHRFMPFYDWSYGCSPTAAAMLFAWWDYRSEIFPEKYPYLVTNYFQRYDELEDQTDYNVTSLQYDLAMGMGTDTTTGSTMPWNFDEGMEYAANTLRGYNFEVTDYYSFPWTRLKNDIDDGRPNLVTISGHTTTGVGYNDATGMAIVHYTWGPPNHLVYINHWNILELTRALPGGAKGSSIVLTTPFGDPRYNDDGEGEIYHRNNFAEIKWRTDPVEDSWVDIFYSTDGGYNYQIMVTGAPNTGVYDWHIPADAIVSPSCRVLINLRTPEMEPLIAGADGSWGNFIIDDAGSVRTMVNGQVYTNQKITNYYYLHHSDPSWAVVGNYKDTISCVWQIQLFDNIDFNTEPVHKYAGSGMNNFIVLDGNHLDEEWFGVKHTPYPCRGINYLQYEGGDDELVVTPGASVQLNWNNNKIVEMYDIHLTPGQYFFKVKRLSGNMNLDIAFFSSQDGEYIKDISQADYISDNWGGSEDSFLVNIDEEDDYGFCIYAAERGAGIFSLKIVDAYMWTGAQDNNWHNPANWSGETVPTATSDVVIPPRSEDPVISEANAVCKSINILRAGRVVVSDYSLEVNGNIFLNGKLEVNNPATAVFCENDVDVLTHGTLDFCVGSTIEVSGDWTFDEGTGAKFTAGTVRFVGDENSMIYVKSKLTWFNNLRISKTGGAFVAYDNCPNIEPMIVKGQFIIDDGASFIQYALYNTVFEGPFLAYAGSHFAFTHGKALFDYAGSGGIVINSEPGSYFNDLTASCNEWLGLASDIEIRGDLLIEEGNFKTLGYDVYLAGDWNDEAWGFNHGNSRVIFNGTGTQTCHGAAFWEMELDKPSGELRLTENTTSAQHYDWTQGNIRVNGGFFYVADLEDSGIYGGLTLTSGTVELHQDPGNFFDLNGDLEISGGEMHIYGGDGIGYWPFSHDASITMSDGVLNVHNDGIRIHNSTVYSLETDISGGTILIKGDLKIYRDDFNPNGGTIEFYGTGDDAVLHSVSGASLFNLVVSKSTKALVKTLSATGVLDVNGDFILEGGNFEAPGTMSIYGVFDNMLSPDNFDELTGTVIFDGPVENTLNDDEMFWNLKVDNPLAVLTIPEGNDLTVDHDFIINTGQAHFYPGSRLHIGASAAVNDGGAILLEGAEANNITVSQGNTGPNYAFDVNAGGIIGAAYTIFIFMDVNGINIHSGANILPEGAFGNCNFAYVPSGGTVLTINNGQDVVIENAYFLDNTTGATYNVAKTVDEGNVYFDGAYGGFSGEAFENDPYNRIHWEYIPPFELPFSEDWSSGDFETNIWTPGAGNWGIDNSFGNPAPSVKFGYAPRVYNYQLPLRSYQLNGVPHEAVILSFDITYEAYQPGTLEEMDVRVIEPGGDFHTIASYSNADGSFDWKSESFDISEYAAGKTFMIGFVAHGEDSWSIEKWNIDNIQVTGVVPEPGTLLGFVKENSTGIPIENAHVTIVGTALEAYTNQIGKFVIEEVPPGTYNVDVSAEGYYPNAANNVVIESGASTDITVLLTPIPPEYCTEGLYTTGCVDGDGINTFGLEEILNEESGCSTGGYGDFTAMTTELGRGYPYPVTLSSNYFNQHVSLWIDLDDDFDFAGAERLLYDFKLQTAGVTYQAVIVIPEDAPTGEHRLRVRTRWGSAPVDPCATYNYGEAEDYTVVITDEASFGGVMVYVDDGAGKGPVDHARVELLGTEMVAYTAEEGYAFFDYITPGMYDIAVTAENFQDTVIAGQYIFPGRVVNLEVVMMPLTQVTQAVALHAGWQGLSSYVMPADDQIDHIFLPIQNVLTLVYNFNAMYWPSGGVNTLQMWDHHDGFVIKVTDDITLNLTGFAEADNVFQAPASWSLLPVISPADVSVAEVLENSPSQGVTIIKEIGGTGVYWPDYNIATLEVLETGRAYLLLLNDPGEIVFPDTPGKAASLQKPWSYPQIPGWNIPVKTASSHLIVIPENVLTNSGTDEGCILGVFTPQGMCCGMAPLAGNTAVTVFADDPLTFDKEGFEQGEKMSFRLVDPKTLQTQTVELEFDASLPQHDGTFDAEGLSVVSAVTSGAAGISGAGLQNLSLYPNPTDGTFWIDGVQSGTQISVVDANGQKVFTGFLDPGKTMLDLRHLPRGVYLVRLSSSDSVATRRIVVF